jgi:Lipocalin-like domain
MKGRITLALSMMALLGLGIGLPASNAVAQQKSIKEQLVGTWMYVSSINTRPDGTKFDPNGGNASSKGVLSMDNTGHFSWQIIRSDIPKLVSNNRSQGTPDELKAVALGVFSYFGTYSLDDSGKLLTQHVENSSFPNYNGVDRKWNVALSGDELTLTSSTAASGGTANVTWKRIK